VLLLRPGRLGHAVLRRGMAGLSGRWLGVSLPGGSGPGARCRGRAAGRRRPVRRRRRAADRTRAACGGRPGRRGVRASAQPRGTQAMPRAATAGRMPRPTEIPGTGNGHARTGAACARDGIRSGGAGTGAGISTGTADPGRPRIVHRLRAGRDRADDLRGRSRLGSAQVEYSRKMRRLATPARRKSFWKSLTMLAGPQRKTESVAGSASVTARTCLAVRRPSLRLLTRC
jgi:hypothetical protein